MSPHDTSDVSVLDCPRRTVSPDFYFYFDVVRVEVDAAQDQAQMVGSRRVPAPFLATTAPIPRR